MTLTKSMIIETVQEELGVTHHQSSEIIEILIETIKATLEKNCDVMISGFGKFCVKDKKARKGRNPATNEAMMLDKRKVVTFKCSGKLKEMVNGE